MIVERIVADIRERENDTRPVDPVFMDHYDLMKPHQKVETQSGRVFAISLEQGESLAPGSVLYEDEEVIIAIELIPEDVLKISPKGSIQWGRAAFNIGNMHQMAYIKDSCILVAYDAILEGIMKKLGVTCERVVCRLEGIRAGVTQTDTHHHGEPHHHRHHYNHSGEKGYE